jgi:uncharacterized membrane protein YGL010W|tara:strand:- start:1410 stop:1889 length:480 start_codon:yes stop_codon:yes gene_type:complete
MKSIDKWFEEYGESHQNSLNKKIHWICIPLIVFSLIGLLWTVPNHLLLKIYSGKFSILFNWATLFIVVVIFYYLVLSYKIAIGMFIFSLTILYLSYFIDKSSIELWKLSFLVFILSWTGQFVGHKIEGKKPSFFKDIQFLFIGPAWLLGFIYRKYNIKY